MDHTQQRLEELSHKWLSGTLTTAEQQEFETWFNQVSDLPLEITSATAADKEQYKNLLLSRIHRKMESTPPRKLYPNWYRVASVAAVIACMAFGIWLYTTSHYSGLFQADSAMSDLNDIAPGRNTATLTLANGKVINLDTNKTSVVATDSVKISTMLTASTPRGGTYQVTLPDGTKAWLNAASSIKFPSSFAGAKQRRVKITGEVYLEVAKDKEHPFIARTDQQEVEVLGTHFNISSYADEDGVKTTLIEGSVKVSALRGSAEIPDRARHDVGGGNASLSSSAKAKDLGPTGSGTILRPGQQAILHGSELKVKKANIEEDMAWKNGDFVFNGEKIQGIMKKISRWYNIDVQYSGDITDDDLYGKVSRNKNISQVLKALESTKLVHFKIEGRKVIVTQ